jgi:GMP synthase (glutamine-hydrolysing)
LKLLSLIHQDDARSGVFAEAATGHELEEWSFRSGERPPRPLDRYEAVLVMGGGMHVDQEDRHPWLRAEKAYLRWLLDRGTPVLGVCLGGQLVADVAGGRVAPLPAPQVGWWEAELAPTAADDLLLGPLPSRFHAFQWHSYGFELPPGAAALAADATGLQAYRLGEAAWGLQFHAEVTRETVRAWLDRHRRDEDAVEAELDPRRLAADTEARIDTWNRIGREICGRFIEAAGRSRRP